MNCIFYYLVLSCRSYLFHFNYFCWKYCFKILLDLLSKDFLFEKLLNFSSNYCYFIFLNQFILYFDFFENNCFFLIHSYFHYLSSILLIFNYLIFAKLSNFIFFDFQMCQFAEFHNMVDLEHVINSKNPVKY